MAYRRGHCTGEKREKQGSQDWYQHYYEEHLARIEAAHQNVQRSETMAQCTLYAIPLDQLTSLDLHAEAAKEPDNPTLEAYTVLIEGQAQRAEVLYLGDRDSAGVAWGADATWIEPVGSAEEACAQEFGALEPRRAR